MSNWYYDLKIAAANIIPFEIEGDDDTDDDEKHPGMDHWEVADGAEKAFQQSNIRPQRTSNISHVAIENNQVIGSVSSEWAQDNDRSPDGQPVWVFKFDVAVLPQFRGPAMIGLKLIQQAMNKYEAEKHMYTEMGGHTMMRLWVVNPRLVPILESRFGFEQESVYEDGSAHLFKY